MLVMIGVGIVTSDQTLDFDRSRLAQSRWETLAAIPTRVGRLVYLSSLRDFNTGHYYHAGWTAASSEELAEAALRQSHRNVFYQVVGMRVEELVTELEKFLSSATPDLPGAVSAWQESHAYQILPPLRSDPVDREIFYSSVKAALFVLKQQAASSPPATEVS